MSSTQTPHECLDSPGSGRMPHASSTQTSKDETPVATEGPAEDSSGPRQKTETRFNVAEAYSAHGRDLFQFALNGLGDRDEAQDCVQEAFIRAWRSADRYSDSRGSVRTWLFAITRNLVIDSLRARARRARPSDPEQLETASEPVPADLSVVERMVVVEALAGLSVEHRQVIVAVQLDGMRYQELSDATGIPVATLRTRMYYGLRSLRTTLGDLAPGDADASTAGAAPPAGVPGEPRD